MEIKLLLFGQLSEVVGADELVFRDIRDTRGLREALHARFPVLSEMKYVIAVDQKMTDDNASLHEGSTVALLPPFSGG